MAVAVDEGEIDAFERAKSRTERRPRSTDACKRIVRGRSPRVKRAVHYEDPVRVDGRAFASALRDTGRHAGLTVRNADVTGLRLENEGLPPISSGTSNRPSNGARSGQIGFETSDVGRTAMSSSSIRCCR
ncbi:hypothetical protein C481_20671 [Natrialba asiatica DSM 12278]|uniref:Uncharacterized protein n=1 Tax=Natrialba asiatica (strain ATCC 700177 / DSM 12278 / JCM 9576 / FERM P-10747 / NBRC 102637 / 172P1) TaxID=29540 RepID=M0AEK5_NATA1|nr:hypothetical protein C481_20671 [Natrialba asiatica DSM 12278]